MHILIVALHRPTRPTGVCRYAANLTRCLSERPEVSRITLVVGEWQRPYFATIFDLNSPKINLMPIAVPNRALQRNLWYLFGLPQLAKKLSPDILHLAFPIPLRRSAFRAPVVSTIHDLYPYECPENFGYPRVIFNRLFLQQCVEFSDGLSCVSQTTQEALSRFFPSITHLGTTRTRGKVVATIYNYADFNRLEPLPPEFSAALDRGFLLCVAQHRKNKNLDLLLKALALLNQNHPLAVGLEAEQRKAEPLKLVLVGSPGPETGSLEALTNWLGLQEQVLFASGLNDRELAWLYQHCRLFVIPSALEGFCLPLAEALYFGCQVVCSDIPIFREVGLERCIYFSLQGSQGEPVANLCQALCQALETQTQETQALQTPPQKALPGADSRFSCEQMATRTLELYTRVDGVTLPVVQ